ncbi:NUDIX domain-containing protein [Paenibacillus rhizovicinus]|uniref:NUDIX domain-containing protein n=1 Tax=Paenibacillus rhizovicinus TaxID=2704463 RepID=A0A6C0NTH1_9BACL|nr:NUDIX domain-containing protein [Paenibacillus rhizovicinus]QHW29510.1 NUDIX domain-containing protein [Paenibacillus rhizovicinus]
MKVTVGVQAVILKDDKILIIEKRDDDGDATYVLPGGKQEFGETIEQAIHREVFEEVGIPINVEELLFLREFIGSNHDNAEANHNLHIVSPIFLCSMLADTELPLTPPNPDPDQIGAAWITVDELESLRFYPKQLVPRLMELARGNKPRFSYVGDLN